MGCLNNRKQVEYADCQTFSEGCIGCCANPRWSEKRLRDYLEDNTRQAERMGWSARRPRYWEMIWHHWRRGGWIDHILLVWLPGLTLGISVWLWLRYWGQCSYAGFIDSGRRRVGCLIHPMRVGVPDARGHAWPLVVSVRCNTAYRCELKMRRENAGWYEVTFAGFRLKNGRPIGKSKNKKFVIDECPQNDIHRITVI